MCACAYEHSKVGKRQPRGARKVPRGWSMPTEKQQEVWTVSLSGYTFCFATKEALEKSLGITYSNIDEPRIVVEKPGRIVWDVDGETVIARLVPLYHQPTHL